MASSGIRLAVDAVVFTVIRSELHLLLIRRKNPPFQGMYALPGGFVEEDEGLDDAALRELTEETGVKDIFLRQIQAYGNPKRDPRGRVVSVAYLALIRADQTLSPTSDASAAEWRPMRSLPKLAFDHEAIVADALLRLQEGIGASAIAAEILPKEFTLTDLQTLHEEVLGTALDKRNFRKKVLESRLLKETGRMHADGAHRPARMYRFSKRE